MRRLLRLVRTAFTLIAIAALIIAAVFFADHPGQVEIVWQGWRIDTSVGVLVAAAFVVALLLAGLVLVLRAILRGPRALLRRRRERRRRAGYQALTRGMVAVAAGDAAEAHRHARRADLLLAEPPLTLLLSAQVAQLEGDETAARKYFTAMIERPETEFLGLRGLINQALRSGDRVTALGLAEQARVLRPGTPWVVDSVFDLQARAGRWEAAQATLADALKRRIPVPERARHHHGVILYELSRTAERRGEMRQAAALAAKAQALAPDLAPAAAHHARLLLALGRARAAGKAVERAWRAAPHPELARVYGTIHQEEPPLARVRSLGRLAEHGPGTREGHLTVAEAALDAQLWGEARHHLERAQSAAPSGPTPRLCRLMARLEEAEHGAGGKVREWLDRAAAAPPDPCYVCAGCGGESLDWRSLCPQCGGFDALSWRPPARAAAGGPADAAPALPVGSGAEG